jgi:hypothetical protein
MRARYYRGEDEGGEPVPITDVMGTIIERAAVSPAAATIVDEWTAIAPERWAEEGRPVGIRRGVLLVEVSSGAAATLLRHDTGRLLARISEQCGAGAVDAIRIRVAADPPRPKTRENQGKNADLH